MEWACRFRIYHWGVRYELGLATSAFGVMERGALGVSVPSVFSALRLESWSEELWECVFDFARGREDVFRAAVGDLAAPDRDGASLDDGGFGVLEVDGEFSEESLGDVCEKARPVRHVHGHNQEEARVSVVG